MDIQKMLDAQMAKLREERLANSDQLSLGELKLKLEMVKDKSKSIVFDFGMKPAGASSWRGSYCELGLEYSGEGGGEASWNSDRVSYESSYGNSYESDSFEIPKNPNCQQFLDMLNALTGKEMVGYKGGSFRMSKNVSVYLGNYGESGVPSYMGEDYATVTVFDVVEEKDRVVIITGSTEY
jgi:hypothetical protein